jgi:hypothetical protein
VFCVTMMVWCWIVIFNKFSQQENQDEQICNYTAYRLFRVGPMVISLILLGIAISIQMILNKQEFGRDKSIKKQTHRPRFYSDESENPETTPEGDLQSSKLSLSEDTIRFKTKFAMIQK